MGTNSVNYYIEIVDSFKNDFIAINLPKLGRSTDQVYYLY